MKKFFLFLIFFLIVFSEAATFSLTASSTLKGFFSISNVPLDKNLHSLAGFSTALFVATISYFYSNSFEESAFYGIFAGTSFGLFKELAIDQYLGGDVEYEDFVYTSYGAAIGGITYFFFSFFNTYVGFPYSFSSTMLSIISLSIASYLFSYELKHGI
jgi:hypothetical protein